MILALVTSYKEVSAVLVPIVGLLIPGIVMAYAFLTIESKGN